MQSLNSRVRDHYDAAHKSVDGEIVARRNLEEAIVSGDAEKITAAATALANLPTPKGVLPSLASFVAIWTDKGEFTPTQKNDATARLLVDAGYARGLNGTLTMSWFKVEREVARDTMVGINRIYNAIFTA